MMRSSPKFRPAVRFLLITLLAVGLPGSASDAAPQGGDYQDLVALFHEWRDFERPDFIDGVPDYSADAMAAQHAELAAWQERLHAFRIDGWPREQQIDWHLVRAEMNGLDFDHRVRQPWVRDPAFYVMVFPSRSDVPAHEGPVIHGWVDLWTYDYPLSDDAAGELAERIGAIPAVLEQARGNLGGNARDLWVSGIDSFAGQAANLEAFGERVFGTSSELDAAIDAARRASLEFRDWLQAQADSKTGPSGIGRDQYTWYMHNVHLVPYSWETQLTLMRRELARAHASLRLEEHRNRHLPELERIDREEYERRTEAYVTEYVRFLEEQEIHGVEDWMDDALRERIPGFAPAEPGEHRNFFLEVHYREPMVLGAHMHHWIELARMDRTPHPSPIRRVPSLSNIYDHRSEGLATGMEEMMMHAGLFDARPRARELVWIMLAQRAARAIGGLKLHANEWTMQEAVDFASEWTPRGWLPADGGLVRGEQHLYLRQPGYGTSYVSGKIQIEELIGEYALELGDGFTVTRFFDDFFDVGVIPLSLVRWEMTGERDPILEEPAP